MKNGYNLGENSLKNDYLFLLKIYTDKNFNCDLRKLIKKWPSSYRKKPLGYHRRYRDLKKINEKNATARKQRIEFVGELEKKDKMSDFYHDISLFMEKYDFGGEWFLTIADFIISDWFYPPAQNLNIKEDKKRVVLTLNPDTSFDDIKDVWPVVKKIQNKLWPDFEKINFTKKKHRNLFIAICDLEKRIEGKGVELDTVENKKYKTTDLDLVSKIWENETDISPEAERGKVSNLRQIRSRFRKKTA